MIDTKQKAKYILEEYANCYSQVDLKQLAKYLEEIKAEAYKEFAELLHCYCEGVINQEWNSKVAPISWAVAYGEFEDVIDFQLKELVGEDNGKEKE